MLVRSLQSILNMVKKEVMPEKSIKPNVIPHGILCQLHPETLAEVTCESEPRAKTRLNEHIHQLPGHMADYQHQDSLTVNEGVYCRPMKRTHIK